MKILAVVGARPQFIKAAVVSHAVRTHSHITEILVHTGQHYDPNMSAVFFEELDIPEPDYHLGVGSGPHGAQTGQMLQAIEQVLMQEAPGWVLVYGDTNSTLAGALAAAKLNIPVAHVEAGLRAFNRHMPEEINRILTDHTADLLFAPTEQAVSQLMREGIPARCIRLVGDVMYDAARHYSARADASSRILQTLALAPQAYILATVHRAENTDDAGRLAAILEGLAHAAKIAPVVLPLHPRTRAALLQSHLLDEAQRRFQVIEPVGYLDMIMLEKHARLIVTDSGGVQKEAFFHRIPCVTLRDETEWTELVKLGWNRLAAPLALHTIKAAVDDALSTPEGTDDAPYGDAHAAERIVQTLEETHP